MFPEIPANWKSLGLDELRSLSSAIRTACIASLANAERETDEVAACNAALAAREEIKARMAELRSAAALESDTSDDEPAKDDADDEGGSDDDTDGDGDGDDGEAGAKGGKTLATTTGQQAMSGRPGAATGVLELAKAADSVVGKRAGDTFESWADLAMACLDTYDSFGGTISKPQPVAVIRGNYDEAHTLSDNFARNLAKFDQAEREVTAALCAPATPYYGLACMNTLRRPVFNSMGQLAAPRMKVSIMPSPTLADITTGVGQWSASDEASANAVKLACQTITCGSPTEYQVYGVYRCMTVRNMLAMSYPELVEAWLNRLGAAHARLAERLLLNAMDSGATAITAPLLGYGASTTIASTLLNYLGLYQETQRWDITDNMELWGHRWIVQALKMEIVRRRNTSGTPTRVPTDEDINRMFRDAGFNPHWFIDTPTWSEQVPAVHVANVLSRFPANVNFLIAPPGKFQVMDRGELRIGVTANGIYRDNNSNARNEFTIFFENFEGIVDTTSCPAHRLTIPVCFNGVQVDDTVMNCQGGDEVGFQS